MKKNNRSIDTTLTLQKHYICMNPIRQSWEKKVNWGEGTFRSLEKFVENRSEEQIQTFVNTEELADLYSDGVTKPDPLPTSEHQEYMTEYAQHYLSE